MRLEIVISNTEAVKSNFPRWLIKQMQIRFSSTIKNSKLKVWDNYLNDSEKFEQAPRSPIKARNVVEFGITNLKYTFTEDLIIIQIDPNIYMPGLDRVKVVDLCNLINFGNLSIAGYPIFTEVFNHTAENINNYLSLYMKFYRGE